MIKDKDLELVIGGITQKQKYIIAGVSVGVGIVVIGVGIAIYIEYKRVNTPSTLPPNPWDK